MLTFRPFVALTILVLLNASIAYAQSATDAGRVHEQLNIEKLSPPPVSPESPSPRTAINLLPGAAETRFYLNKIIIEGITVYSPQRIERIASKFEQREISVADLYYLAAQVTDMYRDDGYVVAQAYLPPQSIQGGVAKIVVVEPYIDEVIIDGTVPHVAEVETLITPWRSRKILNVKDLERTLLLLNDLPGVKAQSVLEPQIKAADDGAMILRLVFNKDDNFSGRISFDNYGSKFIGPFQAGASVTLNNSFGYMSETNIQTFVATQLQELMYGSIAHRIPMMWSGFLLEMGANYSRVVPGYTLDENDIKSQSRIFSLGLSQNLIRSRSENLSLSAGIESRASTTKILGTQLSNDKLTVATLGGVYEVSDSWSGNNSFNLKLRKGLEIFGVRSTGSEGLSRQEGRSDFTLLQMQASRLQSVTEQISVFGSLRGQYAFSPLLSSEEFGYGGNSVGRAYNASEIVGDRGFSGILEARYHTSPSPHLNISPYIFYDFGKVWNIDNVDGTDFSGASAGLGLRGAASNGLSFEGMLAKPLTRRIETPQYGSGDSPVFKFSLEYQF